MPAKIASQAARRPHYIKDWRRFRKLTQQKLADAVETSKQSISRIEKGDQVYTQESLEAIAAVLECSPSDLIGRPPYVEPDIPIFDLPLNDQDALKDYVRALRQKNAALLRETSTSPHPIRRLAKPGNS